MNWKVGDRVRYRYIGDLMSHYSGEVGVVTRIDGPNNVRVELDLGNNIGVYPESLELETPLVTVPDGYDDRKILNIAESLVYGDRNADYGHPADDYERTAKLFSAILGVEVTKQKAILCMIAVKLSRLVNDHTKRDSVIDIAGYAECLDRVNRRDAGLE